MKWATTNLNNQSLANEVKCIHSWCCVNLPSPGNKHHTSEASRSHGFNSGRLCHALPSRPQISVTLWPHLSMFCPFKTLPISTHFPLVLIFCLYCICLLFAIPLFPLLFSGTVDVWHQSNLTPNFDYIRALKHRINQQSEDLRLVEHWKKFLDLEFSFLYDILQRTINSGY